MSRNLRELFQYRALLWSLTQRELQARYRGSIFGFLWTFLNPMLLMMVYGLLFTVYMRQQMDHYTLYMFTGLLPWIWFSSSVLAGASAISDRRDLLTKVKFPPQILPATVVLSNGINFLLSFPLVLILALLSDVPLTRYLLFFPLIVAGQLVLNTAVAYLVSAFNVVFRDLQHLVANLLTLLFFLTPILYSGSMIPERYRSVALFANPMAGFVHGYQDIVYYQRAPQLQPLAVATAISVVLLALASAYLNARREEFAELV